MNDGPATRLVKCPEEVRIDALEEEVRYLHGEVQFLVRIVWAALILVVLLGIWQIIYYGWEVTWAN